MLDVERRVDVEAGDQQHLHVLPAFVPFTAGHVGVGQLIDEHQLRMAGHHGGHIHFLQLDLLVTDPLAGDLLQTLRLAGGVLTAVGLQQTDHHIGAFPQRFPALLEHATGLAHTRSHADEHLVPAAPVGGADHGRLASDGRCAGAVS